MARNAVFATLLTRDAYLPGVLVLERDLRTVKSKYPLVAMTTSTLSHEARNLLSNRGIKMIDTEKVKLEENRQPPSHLTHDARFVDCWSKLGVFGLTDYERVVLLDADMIIKRNMDELMDLELPKDHIAAAHVCACNPLKRPHYPAFWTAENCAHTAVKGPTDPPPAAGNPNSPRPHSELNSGLVVLNPSKDLANSLLDFLQSTDKTTNFIFADQDVFTAFFEGKWKSISWYYNALKTLRNIHPNVWSDDEVRCLHYILPDKPWQARVPPEGTGGQFDVVNRWWWERFDALGEEIKDSDPEGWKLLLANVAKE